MRYFIQTLTLVLFIQLTGASATSYMKFWVNGDTAHTVNQGDVFAWEFDVASPGNTVDLQIWLDMDKSRGISEGDILLEDFKMTDGEEGTDGPADSSTTPDGIIYVMLGQFGFAPQSYYMKAIDEDESSAGNWFDMIEMSEPPATVSGRVYIEGTITPDILFSNIMIGAMGENGIFSGLTDQNGNYIINLPLADADWEIGPFFDRALPGYILQEEGYQQVIPAGNTDSLNFNYVLPTAYIYGDILNQNNELINVNGYVGLENQTTGAESHAEVTDGHYVIPAPITVYGQDSTNYFQFRVDEEMIFSDYLGPAHQNKFPLSYGDSIRKDLKLFETNAVIYGYVTENSELPSKAYEFHGYSDSLGYMNTMSDPGTGYFEIAVRTGSWYNVNLQDDPDWGTPPPPGLVLEENWYQAYPGDTVRFNFVPTTGLIKGTISFDPGDPQEFDYDRNNVSVWDSTYSSAYRSRVNPNNSFEITVPSGKFSVTMDPEENNYLVMPFEIQNVVVNDDTVNNLHFELNYGHAELKIKLINPPFPADQDYWINTTGEWPNVYGARQEQMLPDTSYVFNVCEGDWYLELPIKVDEAMYDVYPKDTVLTVTEQDSSYYIEFFYYLKTSVATQAAVPAKFYLNQNYPNPFNPSTTIAYGLPDAGRVKLTVYNLLGEVVGTLVDGWKSAGSYTIQWQPSNLASGVYLYKLETAGKVEIKKMIFIK